MSTVEGEARAGGRGTELAPGTRALLVLFCALTLLGFADLFGPSGSTAELFAWTIQPPLTAAFLGAGYGSGCLLVVLSLRAGRWSMVRVPLLTILVFTAVTLAATLLHLDKFHLDGGLSIAGGAAWFWLGVYLVVPPLMLVAWVVQERRTPGAAPARMPLPVALALGVEGLLMTVLGTVLFARPGTASTLWPWTLTPLTARAVAAWLIAFGLATLYAGAREGLVSGRVQALSYTVFGLLQLLAVARFSGTVDWSGTRAWAYLAFLLAVVGTGAAGLLGARFGARFSARSAADGRALAPPAA